MNEKYKGYSIIVEQDENPENPRNEESFSHLICWHSKYALGDTEVIAKRRVQTSKSYSEPKDFLAELANLVDENNETEIDTSILIGEIENEGIIILPIFLYDHSGLCISTSPFGCRWDSGQIGYVYCTPEDIKKEYQDLSPESYEEAKKLMTLEIETYDQYLQGDVWGFIVEDENGEQIDSCFGFYGDTKYCIEEAQRSIDRHLKHRFLREGKQLKFEFA